MINKKIFSSTTLLSNQRYFKYKNITQSHSNIDFISVVDIIGYANLKEVFTNIKKNFKHRLYLTHDIMVLFIPDPRLDFQLMPKFSLSELFAIQSTLDYICDPIKDSILTIYNGFVSDEPVRNSLPKSHELWDILARELTKNLMRFQLRKIIQSMPVLDASDKSLNKKYLPRASIILNSLVHAYYYTLESWERLPNSLRDPWETVSLRLGRKNMGRTIFEDFLGNWCYKPSENTKDKLKNYQLLVDYFFEQENKIMCLTVMQIEKRFGKSLEAIVKAQTALVNKDDSYLIYCLQSVTRMLKEITQILLQISPNPQSKNFVDPVIWAKTFGVVGVSTQTEEFSNSGIELPMFHVLDQFIGRTNFNTELGLQMKKRRLNLPKRIQEFLETFNQISLSDYVCKSDSNCLKFTFSELFENYLGPNGFLTYHQRKAYGYTKLGFLSSRNKTNTNYKIDLLSISGKNPWETITDQLNFSSLERKASEQYKRVRLKVNTRKLLTPTTVEVSIGPRIWSNYKAGEKLNIVPFNESSKIKEIASLFGICPFTYKVEMFPVWEEICARAWGKFISELSFIKFLKIADIQTISHSNVIKIQTALNLPYQDIFFHIKNTSFYTWLSYLKNHGVDIQNIFLKNKKSFSYITNILSPMQARLYSITSDSDKESFIRLIVGSTSTRMSEKCPMGFSRGAASYLSNDASCVLAQIDASPLFRFEIPKNSHCILIAAGTGISAFMSFLRGEKARQYCISLIYSVKQEGDIICREELLNLAETKNIQLFFIVTGENYYINNQKKYLVDDSHIQSFLPHIKNLIQKANFSKSEKSSIKIVGSNEFFFNVIEALKAIFTDLYKTRQYAELLISRLIANYQLSYETFSNTLHSSFQHNFIYDIFEIAKHNKKEDLWVNIDELVYDLTKFVGLHVGGDKIIYSCAGTDTTNDFLAVHNSRRIQNNLAYYCVGKSYNPDVNSKVLYCKFKEIVEIIVKSENNIFNNTYFHNRSIALVILLPTLHSILMDPLLSASKVIFMFYKNFSGNKKFDSVFNFDVAKKASESLSKYIVNLKNKLEDKKDDRYFFNEHDLFQKMIVMQKKFISEFKELLIEYLPKILQCRKNTVVLCPFNDTLLNLLSSLTISHSEKLYQTIFSHTENKITGLQKMSFFSLAEMSFIKTEESFCSKLKCYHI